MPRWVRVIVAGACVLAGLIVVGLVRGSTGCPSRWDDAQRVDVSPIDQTYIRIDPLHVYSLGGSAILDYSLNARSDHPLSVTVGVGGSRENLADVEFTCVHVTHRDEILTVRPRDGGIESAYTDGLPSGRSAFVNGPGWPPGDTITVDAWLRIGQRHYVVVLPEMTLGRGG